MNALTICQPHAFFIALPDSDPRAKRVENRGWYCGYRGKLAIHAGKSRSWLGDAGGAGWTIADDAGLVLSQAELAALPFGAFVAVAEMTACVDPRVLHLREPRSLFIGNPVHICGPWCFLLESVRVLSRPIPAKGRQGLWEVTPEQEAEIAAALEVRV